MGKINNVYQWLLTNFSSLAAFVSTLLYLIFYFYPNPNGDYLLALAASTCVFIMIEMRRNLLILVKKHKENGVTEYKTMRKARPEILVNMMRETTRKSAGKVIIIGGRISSITETFKEYQDQIKEINKNECVGCEITLFYVSPEFMRSWSLPGDSVSPEQESKTISKAKAVEGRIDTLNTMFNSDDMQERNIVLNLVAYNEYPTLYGYIFGDETLMWGPYHWIKSESDLKGPSQPCIKLTKEGLYFETMRDWLVNRTELFMAKG